MRKLDFLNSVRLGINNQSTDALKKIIIEFAQLLPRDNFEEALSSLEKSAMVIDKNASIDLSTAVNQLCESVENGDYSLTWDYEDGYYDGHYTDDETLKDNDGLGEEIQALLENAMIYMKEKRYIEAFSAFDKLFSLAIYVEDYDDLDLNTLFSQDLISLDISEVLRHYAYSAVMTLQSGERVQKLFDIASLSHYSIKMTEIEQTGTHEIPQRDEFNKQWVKFLMTQNLYHYEHILIDAVLFSGGIQYLHDFTIEHGVQYQSAYICLTEMYIAKKEYSQAVSVILDGFSKLEGISHVRTQLADLLLDIGNVTNDKSLIPKAAWEGFCSSVDLRHFISICNLMDEDMKDLAIEYLEKTQNKSDDKNYIRFLYGDYESVYIACASDNKFLGWSGSEKGKMIPLFIALLARADTLSPCMKKQIESSFPHSNVKEEFFKVLAESFKTIPDAERDKYMNWCLKETVGRVEAIVGGQHRGSYYKASSLIVSLAEVMRSDGDKIGAVKFIMSYKEKYPRHSSFRSCLQQDIGLAKFGKLF